MSAVEVSKLAGAKCLLVSGGGIGRAIDSIALCETFIRARGGELLGVVLNKVWPEKLEKVRQATPHGLANLGIRSLGVVPFDATLAHPTIQQVARQLKGEVISGTQELTNRTGKMVVAAMESDHMVPYLKDRALVITPGDRNDNIMAIASAYVMDRKPNPSVAGIVLTGGFRPRPEVMGVLADTGLPAILCKEDTYTIAATLRDTVFKLTPDDTERIDAAWSLVNTHVAVDEILELLNE
jgi:BioD-like phosphotransacetylase family protein